VETRNKVLDTAISRNALSCAGICGRARFPSEGDIQTDSIHVETAYDSHEVRSWITTGPKSVQVFLRDVSNSTAADRRTPRRRQPYLRHSVQHRVGKYRDQARAMAVKAASKGQ
jgi:hypothetical protein